MKKNYKCQYVVSAMATGSWLDWKLILIEINMQIESITSQCKKLLAFKTLGT